MAHIDRRASTNETPVSKEAEEARDAVKAIGGDVRGDGSVRRVAPGVRSASDWEKKQAQPMTRADYLNVRSAEEHSRREQGFLRQLWRRITRRPPVVDMNAILADAHARNLADIEREMVAASRSKEG